MSTTPIALTEDQRCGLVSGKTAFVVITDSSFRPDNVIYRAVSSSNPKDNWGVLFSIRDVVVVQARKLKKHGFSNDFVKSFCENYDPDQEVAVGRIKIRR